MNIASIPEVPTASRPSRKWMHSVFGIVCILVLLSVRLAGGMPIGLAYDPNREHCLTDFHLGLFVKHRPSEFHRSDLVMFLPVPALSYVREPFVLKRVAAIPGDHLVIKDQVVTVNGREVVRGLALANVYGKTAAELQRDEVVPPGRLFVFGDAARSDDSRYWGYLESTKVVGIVTRLF